MKKNIIVAALLLSGLTASAQQVLTLQQIKEQALAHNISIRTAEGAVREAREQKKEAFTNYFPQVSATGMGFKTNTNMLKTSINTASVLPPSLASVLPPALLSAIPPELSFSMVDRGLMAGVAAVQPVFAGGRIINGNRLAQKGVEASEIQKQMSVNNVEVTRLQKQMEIGKNMPSIGIGAIYSHCNMAEGMKNTFGMVFATVTVPISQWWGGAHAIKRRQIAEDVARRQLADNRQQLAIRIQKNRDDVNDAYKQLAIARKGIEQSEENLRLNRNFYQAGTVTMNNLLDAQQKYQQCRDRYIEAYAAWQIKIVEYEQSIGR